MSSRIVKLGLLSFATSVLAFPAGHDISKVALGTGASVAGCAQASGVAMPTGLSRHHRHKGQGQGKCNATVSTTVTMEALSDTGVPAAAATSTYIATTTNLLTVTMTADESSAAASADSTVFASSLAAASSAAFSDVPAAAASSAVATIPATEAATSAAASTSAAAAATSAAVSTLSLQENRKSASSVAAAVPTTVAAAAATSATSTASSAPVADSGKKRGVAYNLASLASPFIGKPKVSWAYNWVSNPSGLNTGIEFIPMLWGTASDHTSVWEAEAQKGIANGASALLGFNEPDHAEQANLSPATAATAYKSYITDKFAGKARLGSVAVTNGPAPMGLDYLGNFLKACSACQIDFVVIHWYDAATNVEYFKSHVSDAHTQTGKPVWITEFGASGSDSEIDTFLQTVMPWLDAQDYVERYSYFMAAEGKLISGGSLSSYGNTFATYSG